MSKEKDFDTINNEDQNINEEQVNKDSVETNDTEVNTEEQVEEAPAEQTMEEKYNELNDKFVRLYAEFDNFRRRTNKEKVDLISSASASILKDLVPVLDDFERALENNEKSDDIEAVKEGVKLVAHKFKSLLESKGLKQMVAKGEPFDSEFHEAIANIPAPEDSLKGKVVDDVEKGYLLNEKVIRFAKVVVGQ
ncbi:MAG: nucleotide exchange factor GrpE [Crocinitomicaceae bacterium]